MDHLGTADTEDDSGSLTNLAPSPHSEAVAHEFQELSLQPSQYLPPLTERKNGDHEPPSLPPPTQTLAAGEQWSPSLPLQLLRQLLGQLRRAAAEVMESVTSVTNTELYSKLYILSSLCNTA
uniref:Uncharacterized protein n=1 Tax=Gopherus agassizii TaxID=38772 RepID=A0A452GJF7_9SAUR